MLLTLRLRNFRCFDDHTVTLRPTTVIVGKNNAGKSTIVEALRLVSLIEKRYRSLAFTPFPKWLDLPARYRGVRPSLANIDTNPEGVFHAYHDPPAIIDATFSSGDTITIYIGPRAEVFAVVKDSRQRVVTTKGEARRTSIPALSILPQVGPLARDEVVLTPDYVRRSLGTNLAPLHFRNQLNLFPDEFRDFRRLAESTWSNLKIHSLEGRGGLPEKPLSLLIRDSNFTAEVGWMGHGLQMWLQVMWFLARTASDSAVVLDEPDVYMHADLQRRLARLIRSRTGQVVIATHSVEIMAEVAPEDILVIDRRRPSSRFAATLPAVQRVIDSIGGVHNLHLARLSSARRCLLVEGKDVAFLKAFQDVLWPLSTDPIDAVPSFPIGGWSGWNYAVGSALLLRNTVDEAIRVYCLLDRDYHTPAAIGARQDDARARNISLHIWAAKEIENYLLVPTAIARFIESRAGRGPAPEEVRKRLDDIAQSLHDSVMDAVADEFLKEDRPRGLPGAMKEARAFMAEAWSTHEGRTRIISGKQAVSCLSEWSQAAFGVSFGAITLARSLRPDEVSAEVADFVRSTERNEPLTS